MPVPSVALLLKRTLTVWMIMVKSVMRLHFWMYMRSYTSLSKAVVLYLP